MPTLIYPKSRGTIKLRSVDPFEHPIIDPQYLSHPDDMDLLMRGVEISLEIGKQTALREYGSKEVVAFSRRELYEKNRVEYYREYIRDRIINVYHYASTCKMGMPDDPMAVVDLQLKVRGIANLRVIDCSVMPKVPGCNTNAPCIAIAERAADLIKQEWRDSNRH